jgi:hypothetical protein
MHRCGGTAWGRAPNTGQQPDKRARGERRPEEHGAPHRDGEKWRGEVDGGAVGEETADALHEHDRQREPLEQTLTPGTACQRVLDEGNGSRRGDADGQPADALADVEARERNEALPQEREETGAEHRSEPRGDHHGGRHVGGGSFGNAAKSAVTGRAPSGAASAGRPYSASSSW